jgi:hypothetical protein
MKNKKILIERFQELAGITEDDMPPIDAAIEPEVEPVVEPEIAPEIEVDPSSPVEMLFHGIKTGNLTELQIGLDNIDIPEERIEAILKFAEFIQADPYDVIRAANTLETE